MLGSWGFCWARTVMTPEEKQLIHVTEASLFAEGPQHILLPHLRDLINCIVLMLVLTTNLKGDVDDWL